MTHEEVCGKDTLLIIYEDEGCYSCTAVVRWCYKCGAVVIDTDVDGRTKPGDIAAMRFPKNYDNRKQP
jgi:valyl-tRNA synthetase